MDSIHENGELVAWADEKRAQLRSEPPPAVGALGPARRDLHAALATTRTSLTVLAEPARRSPEEGRLREDLDVESFARACADAGVAALVLPVDARFGLREDELELVDATFPLPILSHDLLVDPRQLHAARARGADGVWLHLGVLDDRTLDSVLALADAQKMAVIAEGRTPEELQRGVRAGVRIACASAFDEAGAQNADAALELLRGVPQGLLRVVRGPVSGQAGLGALRGQVDALWICGPASMPRDTLAYLRSLVAAADRG